MTLTVRMILYFLFAGAASQGVAVFDADAGTLTFEIESLTAAVSGVIGFAGTFIASRWAKLRGGLT
ncbi:MAG: hypothetical protein M0R03_16890 [Novosphingobium sp.]|nr:hypothetical protein [Novosphingobium sp.]